MPRTVIPSTIYFKTPEEKAAALARAKERDVSLSKLCRDLLSRVPPRKK